MYCVHSNYSPLLSKRGILKLLMSVRPSVSLAVQAQISEMTGWINMNFKYVIPFYVRMMPGTLDFPNSQRWPLAAILQIIENA